MKIIAPNKHYTGVSAGVAFANGIGECENPDTIAWFQAHGYEVAESVADEIQAELVLMKSELEEAKETIAALQTENEEANKTLTALQVENDELKKSKRSANSKLAEENKALKAELEVVKKELEELKKAGE